MIALILAVMLTQDWGSVYSPVAERDPRLVSDAMPIQHLPRAVPLRGPDGRIKRSESAKNRFKKLQPCPENGNDRGPCPGYVIDHVLPLACGGADDPSNMQWQTVPDGKAKDRWELTLPGCPAKFSRWHRIRRALNPGENEAIFLGVSRGYNTFIPVRAKYQPGMGCFDNQFDLADDAFYICVNNRWRKAVLQ